MEEIGVGIDFRQRLSQEIFCSDGGLADGSKLRLEETDGVAQDLIDIDASEIRRGHLGKITEAADDAVEIGEFGFEGGGAFGENLLKLSGAKLSGALQIFKSDLHGE